MILLVATEKQILRYEVADKTAAVGVLLEMKRSGACPLDWLYVNPEREPEAMQQIQASKMRPQRKPRR